MHIFLYNKEAFPRPLNRDGEFAQEPYSITVPNEAYIQELDKLITSFNPETMVIAVDVIPKYPVMNEEGTRVVESSEEFYKLKGLLPLKDHERILENKIVFSEEYIVSRKAEDLTNAKALKYREATTYMDNLRENHSVKFTLDSVEYEHGIREKDTNNLNGVITTFNEIKALTGQDITTIWKFKSLKSAELSRANIVQLLIVVQTAVQDLFKAIAVVVADLNEMETIEEVEAYDFASKFVFS